jgi:hypothetical protein
MRYPSELEKSICTQAKVLLYCTCLPKMAYCPKLWKRSKLIVKLEVLLFVHGILCTENASTSTCFHTPEPHDDSSPRSLTPYDEDDQIFMGGSMSLPQNAISFLATPTRSKRSTAFPFSPSSDFRAMYSSLKQPVKKWGFLCYFCIILCVMHISQ